MEGANSAPLPEAGVSSGPHWPVQLSPKPTSKPWGGLPHHVSQLWPAVACLGTGPLEQFPEGLQDSGQPKDIPREFLWSIPVMIVYQKHEALNQPSDSLQWTFAKPAVRTKCVVYDSMRPPMPPVWRCVGKAGKKKQRDYFCCFFFALFYYYFCLFTCLLALFCLLLMRSAAGVRGRYRGTKW